MKFLLPIDFSEASMNSLEYGLKLAEKLGANITLMHSFQLPVADPLGMAQSGPTPKDHLARYQKDIESRLQNICENYSDKVPGRIHLTYMVKMDFPTHGILRAAEEINPDLIILAPAGSAGFFKVMQGDITSSVMDKASCPVMVVPQNTKYKEFEKVAYATNLIEREGGKIEELIRFVKPYDAEITLMHIIESNPDQQYEIHKKYSKWLEDEHLYHKTHLKIFTEKDISEGLLHHIDQDQYDLVVMLRRERNFWEKIFESSLTSKMTRHTQTPMLVYHE